LNIKISLIINEGRPTRLHLFKYTFSEYKWGFVYQTINYYKLFIYKYPYHYLTKGEQDILYSITQLIPRILEQSLLNNEKGTLYKNQYLFIPKR